MALLRVTATECKRLTASEAKLHLLISGETFMLGQIALQKVRELRSFVARCREDGLDAKQAPIEVLGAQVNNASGLIRKNQKVDFLILVRIDPSQLPKLLGIIGAQNNVKLQRLDWKFDDFEASISLAATAMKKARRKANALAKASGHVVLGVHSASDVWSIPKQQVVIGEIPEPHPQKVYGREGAATNIDQTVTVQYNSTQEIEVELTVDFVVEY